MQEAGARYLNRDLSRRSFLKGLAGAGLTLSAAGSVVSSSAPNPSLPPIEHVIVIMFENNSFDHIFGALPWLAHEGPGQTTAGGVNYNARPSQPDNHLFPQARYDNPDIRSIAQLPMAFDFPPGDMPHGWTRICQSLGNCPGNPPPDPNTLGFVNAVGSDGVVDYNTPPNEPPCTVDYAEICNPPQLWTVNQNVFKRHVCMSYYPFMALPVFHTLANNFTVCDRHFASAPTPTWPNRIFTLMGTADGWLGKPSNGWIECQSTGIPAVCLYFGFNDHASFFNVMDDGNSYFKTPPFNNPVSWEVYTDNCSTPSLSGLPKCPEALTSVPSHIFAAALRATILTRAKPMSEFKRACECVGKTDPECMTRAQLPQFCWIEPTAATATSQDAHPPHNLKNAEQFLADVYNTVRSNETLWRKTLIIVTFDEHGGYYDHVTPPVYDPKATQPDFTKQPPTAPQAVPPDGQQSRDGETDPGQERFKYDRLGVRVPTLLISPWIKRRHVDSQVHDHTSMMKHAVSQFPYYSSIYGTTYMDASILKSRRLDNALDYSSNYTSEFRADCPTADDIKKLAPGYVNTLLPWDMADKDEPYLAEMYTATFGNTLSPPVTTPLRLIVHGKKVQVNLPAFSGNAVSSASKTIDTTQPVVPVNRRPETDLTFHVPVVNGGSSVPGAFTVGKDGNLRFSIAGGGFTGSPAGSPDLVVDYPIGVSQFFALLYCPASQLYVKYDYRYQSPPPPGQSALLQGWFGTREVPLATRFLPNYGSDGVFDLTMPFRATNRTFTAGWFCAPDGSRCVMSITTQGLVTGNLFYMRPAGTAGVVQIFISFKNIPQASGWLTSPTGPGQMFRVAQGTRPNPPQDPLTMFQLLTPPLAQQQIPTFVDGMTMFFVGCGGGPDCGNFDQTIAFTYNDRVIRSLPCQPDRSGLPLVAKVVDAAQNIWAFVGLRDGSDRTEYLKLHFIDALCNGKRGWKLTLSLDPILDDNGKFVVITSDADPTLQPHQVRLKSVSTGGMVGILPCATPCSNPNVSVTDANQPAESFLTTAFTARIIFQ